MKRLVIALTAVAAFTGSALAADMAPRTYSKAAPAVAPVASWTGCWVSGGGGYQYDRIDHSTSGGTVPSLRTQNISTAADGWLITGGVGCDYQFNGRWVVGAFGDGTWSGNVKGDYATRLTAFSDIGIGQIKNPWSWAIGARVGYLVAPNVLSYVNAGFTETRFDAVNIFERLQNGGGNTGIQVAGQTLGGVFVGTGFEYGLDFLPGLFLKSEGRAAWFGHKDAYAACVTTGTVCNGPGSPAFISTNFDHRDPISYMAKTELVYRFNWGGPVVAKY
jgi:outer membrane immunogenic protein